MDDPNKTVDNSKVEIGNEKVSLEMQIIDSLRRVLQAIDIYSVWLRRNYGLNASQLSCLQELADSGPLSISQLSKKVILSASTLTSVVDKLEEKELLMRVRNLPDRRVIQLQLTDSGREAVRNAPKTVLMKIMEGLSHFPVEAKDEINRSLTRLISVIESEKLSDLPVTENKSPIASNSPIELTDDKELKK
ncbi:MAG: MarR family transcriptional regulator [Deltaproteobacteria bacterium]|nr:MAG: MarR family transcriptional regulator [Deltaproteobacteria bacterium]